MKEKYWTILEYTIGILIIISITYLFVSFVFFPSYMSVIFVCHSDGAEIINNYGREVKGQITIGSGTVEGGEINDTPEIKIQIKDGTKLHVLKHELIHLKQFLRGYPSLMCSKPKSKYLTEVEAYIFQWLPDFIFEKVYVEIPD